MSICVIVNKQPAANIVCLMDSDKIQMVQRRAARYVTNRKRYTSSVGDMLQHLKWHCLDNRHTDAHIVMMFKISHDKLAVSKSGRLFYRP